MTSTRGRAEYVLLRWRRGVAEEIEPEVDWRAVLHVADKIRGATGLLVQPARRLGDPERWHLPGCPDATDAVPAAEAMPTQRRTMLLRRLIATDIEPRAICPACTGHLTGPTHSPSTDRRPEETDVNDSRCY